MSCSDGHANAMTEKEKKNRKRSRFWLLNLRLAFLTASVAKKKKFFFSSSSQNGVYSGILASALLTYLRALH